MIKNITIIGAGSWGTTLAVILAKKGINVCLHSVFDDHGRAMQRQRENKLFLKGEPFPPKLHVDLDLKSTLANQAIVIAVPVKYVRNVLRTISQQNISLKNKVFISISKGIEAKSLKTVSQIIKEELGPVDTAVLSGPNIAKEILKGIPAAAVVACKQDQWVKKLQRLFTTPSFRVYAHRDILGVELGGALKNIIALAGGISDGLGFGTNTKSALATRGLVEITRLGVHLGARPETFWGISGVGDLMTTCFSPFSRNRHVGEQIGRGQDLKTVIANMKMVAEGVETVKSAYKLGKKLSLDLPITKEVYAVLYKHKSPLKAMKSLLSRPLKEEDRD